MNNFEHEWQLEEERKWFVRTPRWYKREYLLQFDMEDNLRLLVEFEKISDFTLCVVFDRISRVATPLQQTG